MYDGNGFKRRLSPEQTDVLEKMAAEVRSPKHKAVSFKMQDALVITPFSEECDLFLFMEDEYSFFKTGKKSFTELRLAAQEAALKKCEVYPRVTLELIYGIFAKLSGISPEGRERLMRRECELISYFSFPRECGKALFREAKANKKRTVIISESVYPRDVVENILENCGYGSYDELVMVSEIKNCTAESWYGAAVSCSGTEAGKLLHIGSSVAFDIELPIVKGSKALLLAPVCQLMEKSGRILGYIRKKHLYDYDSTKYLTLHCALGLYAAYGFDYPQNRKALSDFCGDGCMLGFLAAGAAGLDMGSAVNGGKIRPLIIQALKSDERFLDGLDDFRKMLDDHFGENLEKYGGEGCGEFLDFLEECCASGDRELFRPYLSTDALKKWASSVKEPEVVPFSGKKQKKSALDRLADKMFPPGTKVRNITDGIIAKLHKNTDN